jgi:hypothetical protein
MPRNAAQHVFHSTPGDGWPNEARQQHVSAITALHVLLRWIILDIIVMQVELAYNATRALGIEHTLFEAILGFSLEEPLDLLFSMRHSIQFHKTLRSCYNCYKVTRYGTLGVTTTTIKTICKLL